VSTDEHPAPRPARPPQGTPTELEDTQRWWLRRVYVPAMSLIAAAALVTAIAGTGEPALSAALFVVCASSLVGAAVRAREQRRTTGRLAQDERDETRTMRTMGYAYCFVFFGVLAWAVAWAATNDAGTPVPIVVLVGLVAALGLGRLCTRREGL
jgi:cobalamin synthase